MGVQGEDAASRPAPMWHALTAVAQVSDGSLTTRLLNPFWSWLAGRIPASIAPNVITLASRSHTCEHRAQRHNAGRVHLPDTRLLGERPQRRAVDRGQGFGSFGRGVHVPLHDPRRAGWQARSQHETERCVSDFTPEFI